MYNIFIDWSLDMPLKPEKLEKMVLRQGLRLVPNKGKGMDVV